MNDIKLDIYDEAGLFSNIKASYLAAAPVMPEDCFELPDWAEGVIDALQSQKDEYGFSFKELTQRGFSETTIHLVKEKYRLKKKYPDAEHELIKSSDGTYKWFSYREFEGANGVRFKLDVTTDEIFSNDRSEGVSTSVGFDVLDMSDVHTYKAPTAKEIHTMYYGIDPISEK